MEEKLKLDTIEKLKYVKLFRITDKRKQYCTRIP